MERHRCELCLKSFFNGRALGGHMRSHMLNLPIPLKEEEEEEEGIHIHPIEDTESAASSSSEEEEEEEESRDGDGKEISYGLRENPKRCIKLVDPEFSLPVEAAAVVVLQDRESETESSKNPTRRRSKRTRKLLEHQFRDMKKLEFNSFSKMTTESWGGDPEQPVSSISDTTTEEDVAFCLMMLSRDKKWNNDKKKNKSKQKYREYNEDQEEKSAVIKSCKIRSRGKYKCETCNKVFKSYQALGGHRASHKKLKLHNPNDEGTELEKKNAVRSTWVPAKKIHECPYCFRVFSSGQALGGHKRSHVIGADSVVPVRISTKMEDSLNLIDLNLPAPIEEDYASQFELSAVSDAEFVNQIKR